MAGATFKLQQLTFFPGTNSEAARASEGVEKIWGGAEVSGG